MTVRVLAAGDQLVLPGLLADAGRSAGRYAAPTGMKVADAGRDALDSRHLSGAAFDVFPGEPNPSGSRAFSTPGNVLTPHPAGTGKQTAANAARIVAADAARHPAGRPPIHCVNPEVLPHRTQEEPWTHRPSPAAARSAWPARPDSPAPSP